MTAATDHSTEWVSDAALKADREDLRFALLILSQRNQFEAACMYATAMEQVKADYAPFWNLVNEAIICRWSERGLDAIKQRAWGIIGARAYVQNMREHRETGVSGGGA